MTPAAGKYGKDFKSFVVSVSPEEHTEYKIRAAKYGVTVAEVVRMCLADKSSWVRAAKLKKESKEKKEGGKE